MTANTRRTDAHRPSAIIPAHYEAWVEYSMATMSSGIPVPPIGIDCATPVQMYDSHGSRVGFRTPVCRDTGRCCVASAERVARAAGVQIVGQMGRCGVCGAHFTYGTLFRHESGDLVHMGHDCADKYKLLYDASAWEIENQRTRQALATAIVRAKNQAEREEFFAANPGLEEDLALGSNDEGASRGAKILFDLAGKLVRFCSLSEKQIAFAKKLANEIRNPTVREVERHVTAPTGKGIRFEGEIVSIKLVDGFRPGTMDVKMVVKMTTEDGATWIAYGTCPSSLREHLRGDAQELRGRRVAVKATLERPGAYDLSQAQTDQERARLELRNREDHFVIMSRPSATFADVVDHPIWQAPKAPKAPRAKKPRASAPSGETMQEVE